MTLLIGSRHTSRTQNKGLVSEGSILGPLLFLFYVNDLPSCQLASEIVLYAEDTVIYYLSTDLFDLESKLNSDLATVSNWFSSNLLTLNNSKCNFGILGNSPKLKLVNDVSLKVTFTAIERFDSFKYVGEVINQTWLGLCTLILSVQRSMKGLE